MATRSKLAVIVHADVAGSTSLVQKDERVAHERIREAFQRFSNIIEAYSGIPHEVRGDALVAEFERASDAVCAALVFQAENRTRNLEFSDDLRPELRIGVALGEVIIADGTLTGTGVVLAQRLEQLASPGSVIVQGSVYDTIPRRLPFKYQNLGEQTLKGFEEPVRAYTVDLKQDGEIPPPEPLPKPVEVSSVSRDLPGHATVAVLPFDNLSNDPEQDYFSDGLTEDVITALAYFRAFPVVARSSTFSFKGASIPVQEISQSLGARYILTGSVRKAGNRVRVTIQLIDGETGHQLWADKYDRALEDVFELQDELTQKIASTVQPELSKAELEKSAGSRPESLRAWDYFLRGMAHLYKETKTDIAASREMFQKAVELEPDYGEAWAGLGWSYLKEIPLHGSDARSLLTAKGFKAAKKAVAVDDSSALAHYVLATAYVWAEDIQLGLAQVEKAIQLNPYFAQAHMALGNRLDLAGRTEEGIRQMERSLELNPRDPVQPTYMAFLSRANTSKGDFVNALSWIQKAVGLRPEDPDLRFRLAACLANVDRIEEAQAALKECDRLQPGRVSERSSWRPYGDDERNDQFFAGLRRHGLIG